jgi:hypothetical protein
VSRASSATTRARTTRSPAGPGITAGTIPTTWEWSENPIVCWYNFERGVFADDDVSDPTKLLVGRG